MAGDLAADPSPAGSVDVSRLHRQAESQARQVGAIR